MAEALNHIDPMADMAERELLVKAQRAAKEFATYKQEMVDEIVAAVSAAAVEKAEFYAEWAVRETGFGVVEHKTQKNLATSVGLTNFYKGQGFAGYEIDHELKVVKFARPAGVVLGLAPCTNPVATVYYKVLVSLMTRNALVVCPHPASKECCAHAADYLLEVAERAGAPKGVVQVVRAPSVELVGAMMKSDLVNVILATGGPAMVRAAYSSGNPALGVGAGNPPHYVDATADPVKTAEDIIISCTFDNNLLCASESVVLAHQDIAEDLFAAMTSQGCHFINDPNEIDKFRHFLAPDGVLNPRTVGQSVDFLAAEAGIDVAEGTSLICVEIDKIDENDLFSREKMFPVIGVIRVAGLEEALNAARHMLEIGGMGHTAAIHSEDPDVIVGWSSLEVCRVPVNGPGVLVAAGFASGLSPTATVGTGYFGRSSVSENVGPKHLIQWTRVAYNVDPEVSMGDIGSALKRCAW